MRTVAQFGEGKTFVINFILSSWTERCHWLPQYKSSALEICLSPFLLMKIFFDQEKSVLKKVFMFYVH